jgi:hypothetical protein
MNTVEPASRPSRTQTLVSVSLAKLLVSHHDTMLHGTLSIHFQTKCEDDRRMLINYEITVRRRKQPTLNLLGGITHPSIN